MNVLEKIDQLKTLLPIDYKLVSSLYALSERSLLVLVILSIISSYFLYPALGFKIILWNFLLLGFIFYRLFCAISFKKNPEKYSLKSWYRKFSVSAFITGFFFAILSFLVFSYNDNIQEQLLIIIILVGLIAGSSTAFSPDYRIEIGYIMIVMIPLFINILIQGTELYLIIAILIIIFLAAKIVMVMQEYKQHCKITQQEEQIKKVKKALKEKQNLLYHFVEEAPLAIFSYDTNLRILDGNATLLKLLKSTKDQVTGFDLATLPDAPRVLKIMEKALHHGPQVYNGPYNSVQGLDLWIESKCFAFNNNEGEVIGGFGIIDDKTKEHSAISELEFLVKHDILTTLLNRRGLEEYLNTFLRKEEHKSFYSLLFYLDLNKFKNINDTLGHKTGDELLIAIGNRLTQLVKKECIISRFGGDEFIVVSAFVSQSITETLHKAKECIGRIQKVFADPFIINDMSLSIRTSIGIVTIEPNTSNIDEIIRHADIAMYQAKKSHDDYTSYYNMRLDKERKKLFILQHDLVNATKNNQLKPYFQPLVSMKEDNLIAAECLLRWEHPIEGLLSPNEFIPLAIETGLISDITWWLVEYVCKYISKLKQDNIWSLNYISINIDAKQLLVNHFVKEFLSKLNQYGLKTSDIMIEITERSIIDNFEDTQGVIDALHNEGIKCAIDDFGTGYSSLSYLKKLSFHTLKIDREFVKDLGENPKEVELMDTILDIGRQFDYNIVIEGIENEQQKKILLDIDEDLIYQGYYFSKPLHADEFTKKFLV